jgi:hypothetical protein
MFLERRYSMDMLGGGNKSIKVFTDEGVYETDDNFVVFMLEKDGVRNLSKMSCNEKELTKMSMALTMIAAEMMQKLYNKEEI